jgi:hypothetical protein
MSSQTFFVNTGAVDKAGNEKVVSSPSITVDTTIPEILDLTCTPYISVLRSLVYCEWGMIKEFERIGMLLSTITLYGIVFVIPSLFTSLNMT